MRLPSLWSPGQDPFLNMRREMDRLFEDFSRSAPSTFQSERGGLMRPAMDVHETGDAIEISAELPGVDEKDLDVRLEDNVLTIRGEKHAERREGQNAHVVERSYGAFQRALMLPFRADPDRIEARFESGVLHIRIPKPDETQRGARRIDVRAAGAQGASGGSTSAGSNQSGGSTPPAGSGGPGGS